MSYTNHTTNLQLPQWLASDKPNWDIDLNNAFQRIDNFAGEKDAGDASLSSRINENQEAITSLQGEVTTLEGVQTTQGERITDLESASTSHASSITKLNNDVDALDGRATSLETRMTSAETDIDALQSQVGLNTGNITTLQDQVGLNTGNITTLQDQVGLNTGNITTLQGRTTSLEMNMSDVTGDITQLQGQVGRNTENIAALQARKEVKVGQISYSKEVVSNELKNTITIQIKNEDAQTPIIAIIPLITLQSQASSNLSVYVDLGAIEFFTTEKQKKILLHRYNSTDNSTDLIVATITCKHATINSTKVLQITFNIPVNWVGQVNTSASYIPSKAMYISMA